MFDILYSNIADNIGKFLWHKILIYLIWLNTVFIVKLFHHGSQKKTLALPILLLFLDYFDWRES